MTDLAADVLLCEEEKGGRLPIEIVYHDKDIIVVNKPSNLRSVPGHADPPPSSGDKKRKRDDSSRLGAQQAWIEALRLLSSENNHNNAERTDEDMCMQVWLQRLGGQANQRVSVPRKYAAFARYLQRSRSRIFGAEEAPAAACGSNDDFATRTTRIFQRIEARQNELLKPPTPTDASESAFGQLQLLGFAKSTADSRARPDLFAVHRLDCATSGLLVFARTPEAASKLCKSWRERDRVVKIYVAIVEDWSPQADLDTEQAEREICLPLAPHASERLKWQVNEKDGKECRTICKVLRKTNVGVQLELRPVTGRTHQLRVHCAATGGPIRGDSLYGTPREGEPLYLHAHRLSFPHPTTQQVVEFEVFPPWLP
jgi:tRNA pseudouridine32 synthase/23S rRNA pseudouridine746 synthase